MLVSNPACAGQYLDPYPTLTECEASAHCGGAAIKIGRSEIPLVQCVEMAATARVPEAVRRQLRTLRPVAAAVAVQRQPGGQHAEVRVAFAELLEQDAAA